MTCLVEKRFTQTDPLPYGTGVAFEGAYAYALNNPANYVDPSGKRGSAIQNHNVITSGGANVGQAVTTFFRRAYSSVSNNWETWGGCGSVSFNIARYSFAKSGCFVDDGDRLWGIDSSEVGVGAPFGLGAGAGSLISNAISGSDLGGYSVCLDVGISVGYGAGAEVCLGMRYKVGVALNSVSDLKSAFSGVVAVLVYASAGVGSTSAVREATSDVFTVWDYPRSVERACGHILRKPTKLSVGGPIPVCDRLPSIDVPFI